MVGWGWGSGSHYQRITDTSGVVEACVAFFLCVCVGGWGVGGGGDFTFTFEESGSTRVADNHKL